CGRRHTAEAESVASCCAMVRRGMSAECTLSAALSGPFVRGALLVRLTHSNVPVDSSTTVDLLGMRTPVPVRRWQRPLMATAERMMHTCLSLPGMSAEPAPQELYLMRQTRTEVVRTT